MLRKFYTGEGLSQSYTGRGVVVGVQDIGFDLTHPNFLFSWYEPVSYQSIMGSVVAWYYRFNIICRFAIIVGRDALLKLEHPIDGETQTHGTHTAGIAAGSGAERKGVVSPYRGMACDADLVLVDNAADNASLIDPKDYYKFTYATDALGF